MKPCGLRALWVASLLTTLTACEDARDCAVDAPTTPGEVTCRLDDTAACLNDDEGSVVSVEQTILGDGEIEGWYGLNGCSGDSLVIPFEDAADDGMTASEQQWSCAEGSEVVLLTIEGGGHTWPQGWPYLEEERVGKVPQDFSANERIWSFFAAHSRD